MCQEPARHQQVNQPEKVVSNFVRFFLKMGAAKISGIGEKDYGVSRGKLDMYKLGIFPNQPFLKTQTYKMIGFGAWHFVRRRFLFFWVHRCLLGNHTRPPAQPVL